MEIEGKIILDLGITTGTSKSGNPWKKRELVLETFGTYPRKVKFTIFGDRTDTIRVEPGQSYKLSVDVESREFNQRWYTDVTCYGAQEITSFNPQPGSEFIPPQGAQQPPTASFPGAVPPAAPTPDPFSAGNETDDLPF